jgi:hypothetical protein
LQQLAISSPDDKGFSLKEGLIRKGNLIWVGNNSALRIKLLGVFHSSVVGGHFGIRVLISGSRNIYLWKGIMQDVEHFVKQCQVCQQAKHKNSNPAGLLNPLPIAQGAWQDNTMDFIEGYAKSEKYDMILVVVDGFPSICPFYPSTSPIYSTNRSTCCI